jgi:hypothetical protein
VGTGQIDKITDACRASLTGTSPSSRPHTIGRLGLAFACVFILLIGAATGCSGPSSAPPEPGAGSPAGGQPATSQSSAVPTWGAATHLDYSQGGEDPTSVACPSASFCMAVLGSGYAARYDGTTWSRPTGLSSSAGEPDSVSCPTSKFCAAVDGNDGNVVTFDGTSWTAPVNIDAEAANSDREPVIVFLMSVSCPSAVFCVAGDSTGDAFVQS